MSQPISVNVTVPDHAYDVHVLPVEHLHAGEYALVRADGQVCFAGTLRGAIELAHLAPSANNLVFKVGERGLGAVR